MKRNSFVCIFKTAQITVMSIITMTVFLRTKMDHRTIAYAGKFFEALFFRLLNVMVEQSMTVFRLPVFYKQRDLCFYPPWIFSLPIWILRIPLSFIESGIWLVLTYNAVGFAPDLTRFFRQFLAFFSTHQMPLALFRFTAGVGRTDITSNTLGIFVCLVFFVFGGFVIAKDDIQPWWTWHTGHLL